MTGIGQFSGSERTKITGESAKKKHQEPSPN
jgi:hypothetical protein